VPTILVTGFCEFPGDNGQSVQLRHVIEGLARDHRVDALVTRRGDQAYVESLTGTGRLLRVPTQNGDLSQRLGAFRRAVRRHLEGADYDVVHFCDPWAGAVAVELAPRLGFATVYDLARSPAAWPLSLPEADREEYGRLHKQCLESANLVLVPHERAFRGHASYGIEKLHRVPPGVDVDTFDWEDTPSEGNLVLYLGTIGDNRGLELLIDAWPLVVKEVDARLVLAGRASQEMLDKLNNVVRQHKLDGLIDYAGDWPHDSAPKLIARALVCVAPGALEMVGEGAELYPTKLLEYFACRRATVAPSTSTVRMICTHDQHALLFEPGKPESLARQIVRFIDDPSLRNRLGEAGYDLVRSQHTASSTRRMLRRAYDWLLRQDAWKEKIATRAAGRVGRVSSPIEQWTASAAGGITDEISDITATSHSTGIEITQVESPVAAQPTEPMPTRPVFEDSDERTAFNPQDGGSSYLIVTPSRGQPMMPDNALVAGEFEVPTPNPDGPPGARTEDSIEFVPEPPSSRTRGTAPPPIPKDE
jgi:glycosyltransferase involved in cell wall biosynthesis